MGGDEGRRKGDGRHKQREHSRTARESEESERRSSPRRSPRKTSSSSGQRPQGEEAGVERRYREGGAAVSRRGERGKEKERARSEDRDRSHKPRNSGDDIAKERKRTEHSRSDRRQHTGSRSNNESERDKERKYRDHGGSGGADGGESRKQSRKADTAGVAKAPTSSGAAERDGRSHATKFKSGGAHDDVGSRRRNHGRTSEDCCAHENKESRNYKERSTDDRRGTDQSGPSSGQSQSPRERSERSKYASSRDGGSSSRIKDGASRRDEGTNQNSKRKLHDGREESHQEFVRASKGAKRSVEEERDLSAATFRVSLPEAQTSFLAEINRMIQMSTEDSGQGSRMENYECEGEAAYWKAQFEELSKLRLTEPEKMLEAYKAHVQERDKAQNALIEDLRRGASGEGAPFTAQELSGSSAADFGGDEQLSRLEEKIEKQRTLLLMYQLITGTALSLHDYNEPQRVECTAINHVQKRVLRFLLEVPHDCFGNDGSSSGDVEYIPVANAALLPHYMRQTLKFSKEQSPLFLMKLLQCLYRKIDG